MVIQTGTMFARIKRALGQGDRKANRAGNIFVAALLSVTFAFALFSGPALAQEPAARAALTPVEALEYMLKTPNVFILDITTAERFKTIHFVGAHHIPSNELISRVSEIPRDRPVIMNCHRGRTVVTFFPLLRRIRPDIKEIYFINDTPLFSEYNAQVSGRR